ncbi:hypothetical protein ACNS7O_05820 [Haloferacaceae archaeon DSL9]
MSLLKQFQNDDLTEQGVEEMAAQKKAKSGEPERTGSDVALLAAGASVLLSWYEFYYKGNRTTGLFVGLWPPTILAFASYLRQKAMDEKISSSMMSGTSLQTIRKLIE